MRAAFLLVLPLLLAAPTPAADHTFIGFARDPVSGALLYVETHAVTDAGTPREQRVVLYRCDEHSPPFARKSLSYDRARSRPSFQFEDVRSRHAESLSRMGSELRVAARAGATAPWRQGSLADGGGLVADAGFDELVRESWPALERGETLQVPFLVPSRLDSVEFRVRKARDTTIAGAPASVFKLSLAGPLGWFLPDIEVSYRKSDRRLLRYLGLTNIRDAQGELLRAQIDFPQPPRLDGPVDLAAMRALPLASCGS
jgi:hypothetical protein